MFSHILKDKFPFNNLIKIIIYVILCFDIYWILINTSIDLSFFNELYVINISINKLFILNKVILIHIE